MYRWLGRGPGRMRFCQLDNKIYGIASRMGGSSSDSLYQVYASKFYNKDLEEFKDKVYQSKSVLPGVTIVTTPEEGKRCLEILMQSPQQVVAWDTETMDLDIKQEAPVGKGKIICASFFAGPQFDFGRGPKVFVDNFGHNAGLLSIFKPYLQSDKHLKVWHNYGFDRHLFYNHGIDVRGFGGDTMHMARLLDSSKSFGKYSLAELTSEYGSDMQTILKKTLAVKKQLEAQLIKLQAKGAEGQEIKSIEDKLRAMEEYTYHSKKGIKKTKMQLLFGRKRVLKSGQEGVTYEYPTTLTLHTSKQYIPEWISYSVMDSESTYLLREVFKKKLSKTKVSIEQKGESKDLWQFYQRYWLPFGQVLTELQRQGIKVDMQHMKDIEQKAKHDLKKKEEFFLNFLYTFQSGNNIDHFNPSSTLQLQQLLFAPCEIKEQKEKTIQDKEREDKEKNMTEQDREMLGSIEESEQMQKKAHKAYDIQKKGARKPVILNQLVKKFKVQNKLGKKPKFLEMEVMGLGLPYHSETPTGLPSVDIAVLEELAGNPEKGKYGKAYTHFEEKGNPEFGKKLCQALRVLVDYSSNQTLLKTFIQPLSSYVDSNNRVHCSLNINTETGRLSARKPNLQNQPALDKDVYKIRKAFVAEKGKKLIVADYGQLELRVLAHLTNCRAMIEAFEQGGDFHSRTAIGMYDYIRKEIDEGTILLEWDKSKGPAPVPLLKEKYAAERKQAKTVNFSIAYGKTAKGFANDWGCSLNQAKEIIDAWFRERKEVKQWQEQKQRIARDKHITQTLLGRQRKLDKFYEGSDPNKKKLGMANRRAINTPIQGGAADIVNASMVKIARNSKLKQMGWKLLMQIHDELILEGPQESAAEALEIVKYQMEHPFQFKLRIDLEVDAKIGNNWYECK